MYCNCNYPIDCRRAAAAALVVLPAAVLSLLCHIAPVFGQHWDNEEQKVFVWASRFAALREKVRPRTRTSDWGNMRNRSQGTSPCQTAGPPPLDIPAHATPPPAATLHCAGSERPLTTCSAAPRGGKRARPTRRALKSLAARGIVGEVLIFSDVRRRAA